MTPLDRHMESVREFLKHAPPSVPGEFERHRDESKKGDRSLGIMLAIAGAAGVLWQVWSMLRG